MIRILFCSIFLFVLRDNFYGQKDSLINAIGHLKDSDTSKTKLYLDIAYEYYSNYEYDSAIYYAQRGKLLGATQKYIKGVCLNSNIIGLSYSYLGKYKEAEKVFSDALIVAKSGKNKKTEAKILNSFGVCYTLQAKYTEAINKYMDALKIEESFGENKPGIANLNNNIGVIYTRISKFDLARSYHHKALSIRKKNSDSSGIALSYNNLANTFEYKTRQSSDSILYYQTLSLKIREKLKNEFAIAQSWNNIGNYYLNIYEPEKALEYYEKAYAKFKESESLNEIINTTSNLADVYYDLKDYDRAGKYAEEAVVIARQNRLPEYEQQSLRKLGKIYLALGNYRKSAESYAQYVVINDTLFDQSMEDKLTEARYNFEFEKKEEVLLIEQEKKDIIAREEQEQKNIVIVFISLILFIALVFGFYVFRNFKKQKQANIIISFQKQEVENQKSIIEEHQKEILDSIHYAKRIQNTLLAHKGFVDQHIKENFILFKPKDIVSGDFYWAAKHGKNFYIAACDSTGHGVPGAFMSLLNINFLNEAINEKDILEPNEILNFVRKRLISSISKDGQKDGFDGILLRINEDTGELNYAAANNAPVLISNGTYTELEADRMPVGQGERQEDFKLFTINYMPGDTLYLYTDGYADQFGGPKGKKFKYKPLNELLLSISNLSFDEQSVILSERFEDWRKELEQVDDVCVIGIRV